MVGAPGFEPGASGAQPSDRNAILLVRLALFYVTVLGFGPNSSAFGPKLAPFIFLDTASDFFHGGPLLAAPVPVLHFTGNGVSKESRLPRAAHTAGTVRDVLMYDISPDVVAASH